MCPAATAGVAGIINKVASAAESTAGAATFLDIDAIDPPRNMQGS